MSKRTAARGPRKLNGRSSTRDMVDIVERLAAFEEFEESVLPALRKDMKSGMTAEDLYKKYQALAAARGITIALTECDSGKAISAIKDILDRSGGKPTERKEVEHRLAKLPEEQLDALLLTELSESAGALEGAKEEDEDDAV